MASKKVQDTVLALGGNKGEPLTMFHGYNLDELNIPKEARPLAGQFHAGKFGYTVRAENGAALWQNVHPVLKVCFYCDGIQMVSK